MCNFSICRKRFLFSTLSNGKRDDNNEWNWPEIINDGITSRKHVKFNLFSRCLPLCKLYIKKKSLLSRFMFHFMRKNATFYNMSQQTSKESSYLLVYSHADHTMRPWLMAVDMKRAKSIRLISLRAL